ncbi:MAG: Dabb family protein [Opitutales bacterium]
MKRRSRLVFLLLALLFAAACQPVAEQSAGISPESEIGMLQHNVYFYFTENVTDEEKAEFEEGLKELLSIDEVHKYQIGIPGATEDRDVTDHTFGYAIFSWFQTMEDYDVYADHPVHLDFIDEFSHLWADVKVYDSEIIY